MFMEQVALIELIALSKIDNDSTVENFGGIVNSSFFEAANLVGGLKIKGLVDIMSEFPGPSPVKITPKGKKLLKDVTDRIEEKQDRLDKSVLEKIGQGFRTENEIERELNVATSSLAVRFYKLKETGMLEWTIRNGKVALSLTENGFNMVGPQKKTTFSQAAVKDPMKRGAAHGEHIKVGIGSEEPTIVQQEVDPEQKVHEMKTSGWQETNAKIKYTLYKAGPVLFALLMVAVVAIGYLVWLLMQNKVI